MIVLVEEQLLAQQWQVCPAETFALPRRLPWAWAWGLGLRLIPRQLGRLKDCEVLRCVNRVCFVTCVPCHCHILVERQVTSLASANPQCLDLNAAGGLAPLIVSCGDGLVPVRNHFKHGRKEVFAHTLPATISHGLLAQLSAMQIHTFAWPALFSQHPAPIRLLLMNRPWNNTLYMAVKVVPW